MFIYSSSSKTMKTVGLSGGGEEVVVAVGEGGVGGVRPGEILLENMPVLISM